MRFLLPLTLSGVGALLCVAAAGCSDASGPADAPIRASETALQAVSRPLKHRDVDEFLRLIEGLPKNDRPQFAPSLEPVDGAGLSAEELIAAYRSQYADALDLDRQSREWASDVVLLRRLEEAHISPAGLAAMLTRVSCAHQASIAPSLEPIRDQAADFLAQQSAKWDAGGQTPLEQDSIQQSIAQTVALDEYAKLLAAVPVVSRMVVSQKKDRLSRLLPAVALREHLERFTEVDTETIRSAPLKHAAQEAAPAR